MVIQQCSMNAVAQELRREVRAIFARTDCDRVESKGALSDSRKERARRPPGIETQRPTQFQWRRSPRLRDDICLGEKAPHVDDRFAGKIEVAISGMRRAQDEEIAAAYHLLQTEE